MQIKTIKFKSGEVIACGVDDTLTNENLADFDFITINKPVTFSTFKFVNHMEQVVETVGMSPFIPTSNDEEYIIPTESILTICSLRPGALNRYTGYLDMLQRELSGVLDQQAPQQNEDEIWDAIEEARDAKFH